MKKLIFAAAGVVLLGLSNVFAYEQLIAGPLAMIKGEMQSEIGLSDQDMKQDSEVINEQKTYEYQTAKSIIDMHGYRVRMEQYLSKPNPNQLKLEVYNYRDHRTDTLTGIDTYNTTLPTKLSEIVKQGGGDRTVYATTPDWYVTGRQVHMENDSGDYADNSKTGGKVYEMNDTYNGTYYGLLYDSELTSITGKDKVRIDRYNANTSVVNATGYLKFYVPNTSGDLTFSYDNQYGLLDWTHQNLSIFPTVNHSPTLVQLAVKILLRQPIDLHESTTLTFKDNTSLKFEQAWVSDDGKIINTTDLIRAAIKVNQGQDWRAIVKQWNVEGIVTASEWQGRNIDIIWSPLSLLTQVVSEQEEKNIN